MVEDTWVLVEMESKESSTDIQNRIIKHSSSQEVLTKCKGQNLSKSFVTSFVGKEDSGWSGQMWNKYV